MATVEGFVKSGPRPSIPAQRRDLFTRLAAWTIRATGGRWGFYFAFGSVLIWAVLGPYFHYSQNWQLVINTGTTIVTFLMVFLIQNAQNRESKATHLKLDELILAVNRARNELIDIEKFSEEQLDQIGERYREVAAQHHHKLEPCFVIKDKEKEAAGSP
jgi:low affinity Fe/Cu permease